MQITGSTGHGKNVLLYQNNETVTNCTADRQNTAGTSVCDLMILIPINSDQEVRVLNITAINEPQQDKLLQFCEVQVYAGKCELLL